MMDTSGAALSAARRTVVAVEDAQRPPSRSGGREVRDLSWDEGERLSEEQQRLHPSIDRIRAWAEQHPDLFAGVWLDNSAFLEGDGPVRIGVGVANRDPGEVAPELEALVDDPSRLVLVRKDHPEADLRAAQQRVVERWMQSAAADRVTGCGVDVHANRLEVMLPAPDPAFEDEIRAANPGTPTAIVYGYASFR